ncbi:hypothetical protein [Gilvibacter sp.]|uniref:hypothetical protein n=1 Tax=Gilvibacter sp. TaxID=2729997 RepID=UPI003B52E243
MNKIISHELSKFGKLNVALHHKSTDFYTLLESKGIINYLKGLDHLGYLSKSNPGNNHKRWDYVVLQLYILHKLKDGVFRTGLSSNHTIHDQLQTSGIVILQIAVLFANLGHLSGTIASESALLDFLNQNNTAKTNFLSNISTNATWNQFSENIFSNNDVYKTKYLIALNFLFTNCQDEDIKQIILVFFQNSLVDDEPKLRKLKWVFHKVRQISFIYLDSFNSDFGFRIDITKILLNPYNYKTLFNPNSIDYESFFDSCETALTKKLYITENAAKTLEYNKRRFFKFLVDESSRSGNNKLVFNDFLISLITRKVPRFEIKETHNDNRCYQFYVSKDDLELFGIKREFFNYYQAQLNNYKQSNAFNALINKGLTNKEHMVCLVHDGRKTLFFLNLVLNYKSLLENEQDQFILNYLNVHSKFLDEFKFVSKITAFKSIAITNLRRHYSRKVFLQLFKILFNCDYRLNSFIKFDYHQVIKSQSKTNPNFHATGYVKGMSVFKEYLTAIIANDELPADLKNNHRIANHIVDNVTQIKRYVKVFYCLFPIEVDQLNLDPSKLYQQQNPESAKTLTDVDMVMAIFNSSKFELYLIEGKNQGVGFQAATNDDFNNRINPNLKFPNAMPTIQIVNEQNTKGGFVCYSNV